MGGLIYKIFPGIKDFEEKAEQAITYYNEVVATSKSLGDYLMNNGDAIIEKIEKGFGGILKEIKDDFTKNVKISPAILKPLSMPYAPSSNKGNGKQRGNAAKSPVTPAPTGSYRSYAKKEEPAEKAEQASPAPSTRHFPAYDSSAKEKTEDEKKEMPVDKKTSLDEIVKEFKDKLKQFNSGYDVGIDVYDNGSIIRSYSPYRIEEKKLEEKVMPQIKLQSLKLDPDKKYLEDSIRIAELYNQGYKTNWIIREAMSKGIEGVRNRTDITDRVALSIDSGFSYTKSKYDNIIASKLGAKEQLVTDYLSGKSYKEIKENLKARTNGMSISDSSILRTMHKYEKQAGKKVVGKRNGNGKARSRKK